MKKVFALILSLCMVFTLCACGQTVSPEATSPASERNDPATKPAETATPEQISLKVWGSQTDQDLLKELCEAFAGEHPEKEWTFEYGVVGEADAQARYLEDPTAAADVFSYPDDQIITLVQADALYEVTRSVDQIKSANAAGTVNAASYNGILYGYPMTADNGYYLYYDKSVLTDDDVKTLDSILAAANTAGKQMHMDVSNGWYLASFFLGNGCQLTLDADGNQICDFNSEKGLAAAEAIRAFCKRPRLHHRR